MANINLEVSAGQSKTITFQSAGKFTTEDVVFNVTGAAGSTTIATSSGTNQITLAHGTKYVITAAGSSYVFTMPSLPSASSSTAGITTVGASGGAASYGHTHTTSIATSTGTNQITLEHGGKYSITAGGTSYIFTMPSQYSHPTSAGNKHIPSGGSSGQFLGWSASGTATWVDNPNTDFSVEQVDFTNSSSWHGIMLSHEKITDIDFGNNNLHKFNGEVGFSNKIFLNPSSGAIVSMGGYYDANGNSVSYEGHTHDYSASNHTHTTTIATSTGTNQITLAFGTKYAITAGGTSYVFTMPSLGTTSTTAAAGNHTHSGYLTSSSSLNAANLTGTIPSGCYTDNNSFGTVLVNTDGGTAAKVGIAEFPYVLNTGNCFILYLKQNNTVANATLNVKDTGAKDVYLDGAKVTASNWKAGTYLFYYDGARYHTSSKNPFSNTNTTYTIATGDSNGQIKVTPSSGNAYNVNVKGLGSAAYTASTAYATSGHTHSTSIATSTGTNQITLAFGTKYAITAGGTSYVFTMPSNPNTDSVVQQDDLSSSANWHYPLLSNGYSSGALDGISGGETDVVGFSIKLAVNPSEGAIYTAGYIQSESGFKVTGQSGFLMADGSIDSNSYSLSNHTHNYAASSHSHGSITSGGAISSGTALANGDAIVFSDSSDNSKLKKSTITFDGSTTTKFLSQKGTWETPSGGGGSTVAGKTVELSTSSQALITVNGSDSGNVKLPDTCPWITDPANRHDIIGGVTPIFRADTPRVEINGNNGDFSDIQDVNSVNTLFLFPDVGKSHSLFALPVAMDNHGRLFVLISEALAVDVFLNNGMSTDAGALSGK